MFRLAIFSNQPQIQVWTVDHTCCWRKKSSKPVEIDKSMVRQLLYQLVQDWILLTKSSLLNHYSVMVVILNSHRVCTYIGKLQRSHRRTENLTRWSEARWHDIEASRPMHWFSKEHVSVCVCIQQSIFARGLWKPIEAHCIYKYYKVCMMKVIFDEHWVPSKMWYTRSHLPESAVLFRMWLSWMIPCQPWTLMWVPKSFKDALWRSETGRLTQTDMAFQEDCFYQTIQLWDAMGVLPVCRVKCIHHMW